VTQRSGSREDPREGESDGPPTLGLALGGGAVLGAAHIGVLRLQVDDAPEPIAELQRLVDIAARQRNRR